MQKIDTRMTVAEAAGQLTDREDPLNVLRSTAAVVRQAYHVRIDMDAVSATAGRLAQSGAAPPTWNTHYHFTGDERSVASFVLVLDTLNYCFWPEPRWLFDYQGETLGRVLGAGVLAQDRGPGRPADPRRRATCPGSKPTIWQSCLAASAGSH